MTSHRSRSRSSSFPPSEPASGPGPRRARSGARRATKRAPAPICAIVFGAGADRLTPAAARCGWKAIACISAAEVLDRADDATAIILAPSDAELRAALDTLSALRNSGYDNPIVVAVEAGDVRDLRNDSRAVEARARGASTTISQALAPEHVLLNATFMLPDAIQTALRDSTPPSAPRPAPLRHGRLRVEDGRAYLGRRELDLERSEYDTLVFLLENRGRAVCERHYWEQKRVSLSPGAFRTRICNLRDKLRDSKGSLIQLSSTQPGHYGIGI